MPENNSAKKHQMKLRSRKHNDDLSKKKIESSESDSGSWEEEEQEESSENEPDFDLKEYRTLLSKIFPSKYISEKAKNTLPNIKLTSNKKNNKVKNSVNVIEKTKKNKKKNIIESDEEEEESADCEPCKIVETKKHKNLKTKKTNKKNEREDESEDIAETEDDSDYDEMEDEYEDEDEESENKEFCVEKKGNKFNIVFTIGSAEYDEDEDDDDYEDDEDDEDEDEDDEDDDEDEDDEEDVVEENSSTTKTKKLSDEEILNEFKEMAKKLQTSGNKNNKVLQDIIKKTEEQEKEFKQKQLQKDKKKKNKNCKQFKGLMKNKNIMNDLSFFKNKMNYEEQCSILKEMELVQKITKVEKPYRIKILESDIPPQFKACALKKLNQLRYMEPGSGEYYKIKNWVDTFMQIPFGVRNDLPISFDDGVDKCHEFMDNAKQYLDKSVFGLNDAKLQIMQMVGQWISNPDAIGTAIAIHGPMGTGKTTLVKEGISKILNREFAFIALGGATDSSFLEGHSYTYEGSTWGRIVDIIIQCKSMNPVIYFDELDKVSDTPKGEEIIGILTHLTDTSQNSKFHDKYFSEIDFDLSKCLFIFSYNDERKVNPILRDRMYRINTSGYNKEEKTTIAKDYLLPIIREQVRFEEKDIIVPTETIQYIIEKYTDGESGVRNLKRCLEIIYTKLNLYRLMKPDTNLFEKEMSLKIEFPLTVTNDIVAKLIKAEKVDSVPFGMYN